MRMPAAAFVAFLRGINVNTTTQGRAAVQRMEGVHRG